MKIHEGLLTRVCCAYLAVIARQAQQIPRRFAPRNDKVVGGLIVCIVSFNLITKLPDHPF